MGEGTAQGGEEAAAAIEIEEGAITLFLLDYILPIFIVPIGFVFQATKRDILIHWILLS